MSNNQPPQLPSQPPQLPPQLPQSPYQSAQSPYQPQYNTKPPKKKMSTGLIAALCIAGVIVFCVIASKLSGDKPNGGLNEISQQWKDKAIKDSTNLSNGYFSTTEMSDFEVFVKKYHELEVMALQKAPKEVSDSTIIRMGNRNANNAMAILTDSMTVYRNLYTKIIKNKLWLDNIKVKTENDGKTLWLIGALFANNRNIDEFQKGMRPMFKALGYKRIYYKWADISSAEYTYYDMDK